VCDEAADDDDDDDDVSWPVSLLPAAFTAFTSPALQVILKTKACRLLPDSPRFTSDTT
jgi:hypothetical protein